MLVLECSTSCFLTGWFCPYVQRTWMALEIKGIPYRESKRLKLDDRFKNVISLPCSSEYKEENPYHKVGHRP